MSSFKRILLLLFGVALAALAFFMTHSRRDAPGSGTTATSMSVSDGPSQAESAGTKEAGRYRPKPAPQSVREQADQLIRRYQGVKREEFEKSAELQSLGERFFAHLDTPAFQKKLEEAIEDLKATKGIEHGTLSFELNDLETPNARAWIEAALSEDPQLAQDYVMNLLEGAIFEFAIDPDADSTSDGVTVKGAETAPGTTAEE